MKLLIEVEFGEDGTEAVAQVSGLEALLETYGVTSLITITNCFEQIVETAASKLEALPKYIQ